MRIPTMNSTEFPLTFCFSSSQSSFYSVWVQCGFNADPHTESQWISADFLFGFLTKLLLFSVDSMWIHCGSPHWIPLNFFWVSLWTPHKAPSIQRGFNVDSMRIPTLNPTELLLNFLLIPHKAPSIQFGFNVDSMRIPTLNPIEFLFNFSLDSSQSSV